MFYVLATHNTATPNVWPFYRQPPLQTVSANL